MHVLHVACTFEGFPVHVGTELSFMGSYGHPYLKPTVVFGTASGSYFTYIVLYFTGICIYCCTLHMGAPSSPKTPLAIPSPWAIKMKKKLTKKVRKRAKRNSKKRAMVRKYKNHRGETRVCLAYECFEHMPSRLLNSTSMINVHSTYLVPPKCSLGVGHRT